jgi:uncharacterized protein YlaN (UPF0358 family)
MALHLLAQREVPRMLRIVRVLRSGDPATTSCDALYERVLGAYMFQTRRERDEALRVALATVERPERYGVFVSPVAVILMHNVPAIAAAIAASDPMILRAQRYFHTRSATLHSVDDVVRGYIHDVAVPHRQEAEKRGSLPDPPPVAWQRVRVFVDNTGPWAFPTRIALMVLYACMAQWRRSIERNAERLGGMATDYDSTVFDF